MSSVTDWDVVRAMETCGGSFVRTLALCFHLADQDNYGRLKVAFPEYWQQYSEMAVLMLARDEAQTRETA
jgi:hypothetical protein